MIPLVQGLLALALPLFAIWRHGKGNGIRHPQLFVAGSFACCAWGIIAELTTIKARLLAGDVGGIEDTIDAVIIMAVVLTAVTVIADVIALSLTGGKDA